MTRLHLDYETYSEVDTKKVGGYKYVRHPSTEILMLGWAFDDEPVQLWQPRKKPMPSLLGDGLRDPYVTKKAFNAAFERGITEHKLGIAAPANEWTCTMVESYYLGFAGGLDKVLEAIGLQKKDPRGGQLINLFSKPAPKNHKADRYTEDNRPQEWAEFCQYCITDVEVERRLWHWLQQFPTMPGWDHSQWQLDQRINERGVLPDVDLAKSAIELWSVERDRLTQELQDMTGLGKVTRGPFLEWMEENTGVALENLSQDYLSTLLNKGELPEEARPYVQLWAQKEAKAVSKYTAVINAADDDDHRARGMFQYKGASRTDRVGGRLIQLQNLKRPFVSQAGIDPLVDTIKLTDPQFLKMLYPQSVSESLGGAVRHALMAPEGRCFAVCDLTSVESVVLGWISMCPEIDRTFREGRDSYKTFASNYFGIPYGEVTKGQRSFSKPPVLGCGFMLGWKGLIAYAEGYGVDMDEAEARRAVDTFRGMYPEIPQFWKWIYDAVKYTTQTWQPVDGYRMRIDRDADFLRIRLPSGRNLSYYKPEVVRKDAPWSTPEKPAVVDNFSYMGMNDKNQWGRIFAHAGGVTENIVQSIAGDLLWNGIRNAEGEGLEVVVHVHDEIAVECDMVDGPAALATLEECMTQQPHWAADMWIGADGFLTRRYTKG